MILIADSGSTKCDWISVDINDNQHFEKVRTKGLNPAILNEETLTNSIADSAVLVKYKSEVSHVFFYGAGCGTEKPKQLIKRVLESLFTNAIVEVKEDTLAAVRATLNDDDEAAVVCILGTGSNCSYFDGKQLNQKVSSLGYTIMDDASGNYFGRQLIRDYYFNRMPEDLSVLFANTFNLEADHIKNNLYKQANPNAFLASYAEFMFAYKDVNYITELIKDGMRLFAENMIFQYKDKLNQVPVHFAGSIAYLSKEEIIEVSKEMGFTVGNFARRPIEGLVAYHINKLA